MADAWRYGYTDFGEGAGRSPQPVLRAVVRGSVVGAARAWSALVDTGTPITIVRHSLLAEGGDPVDTGATMVLRLGGSTNEVPLYELTLEVRPPTNDTSSSPVSWRGVVAVLDRWPHQGTAIILGQAGFLETFAVTFGPDGFVLEPAAVFHHRFPPVENRPQTVG